MNEQDILEVKRLKFFTLGLFVGGCLGLISTLVCFKAFGLI